MLGSAAVAIADRVRAATEAALPFGASAPAAVSALHTYMAGATIDALARVLGLTHSGTVRLVDRLAQAGLVERRGHERDPRAVALHLTPEGIAAAERVIAARLDALDALLAPLSAAEQEQLAGLLGAVLGRVTGSRADARRICRLCEPDVCGHPETCPVTQAVPH